MEINRTNLQLVWHVFRISTRLWTIIHYVRPMERFGTDLGRQTELSGPLVVRIHAGHPYVRFQMLSAALEVITKPPDQSLKKTLTM